MARILKKEHRKVGAAPGSLIFVGTRRTERVTIEAIQYGADRFDVGEVVSIDKIGDFMAPDTITWLNVTGLHDTNVIRDIGKFFDLHPLFLEDVLNTDQRPKFDVYENFNAFFLVMLRFEGDLGAVEMEQVAIAAGKNFVISFQESERDVFDTIRDRLKVATTGIRTRGTDYLAFSLMDAIIDNYVISIEHFGTKIETLEDELLHEIRDEHLIRINTYKREINALRRVVRPVLEIAAQYHKSDSPLISPKTRPFIKDLVDHSTQAAEAIEIYKELLNDELSLYHASVGERLNDIIRVLTIFSVIFIPITFLAGVYGMNFSYFPELDHRWAYPAFWGVSLLISLFMLWYFWRKGWLK